MFWRRNKEYIFGCVSKILVDSSNRVYYCKQRLLNRAYFNDVIQTFTYKELAKNYVYFCLKLWCISNLPLLTPNQKIRTLFYVELWTLLLSSIRSSMTAATFFVVVIEEWRCLQFYYSLDHKSVQLIMQIFDRSLDWETLT